MDFKPYYSRVPFYFTKTPQKNAYPPADTFLSSFDKKGTVILIFFILLSIKVIKYLYFKKQGNGLNNCGCPFFVKKVEG